MTKLTTPTTPSEWDLNATVEDMYREFPWFRPHGLGREDHEKNIKNFIKDILHHNTEDIIGQVASKLDWIVENMENYSSNSRARKNLINDALKPTHKE